MRKTVLIADDHELMLAGVRDVLAARFEVVGGVKNGHDLVQQASKLRPDIVILDIGMPVLNGIEAARQINASIPHTRMIFLTQQLDRTMCRQPFELARRVM